MVLPSAHLNAAAPAKATDLVVKRSRRISVEAGSMASARASLEREEDRNAKEAHVAAAHVARMKDGVAAQIVTSAAMFVYFDEERNGYISRDGFAHVTAALGMNKDASLEIFKELEDPFGTGQIHYGAYLAMALRDGLARASARLVALCRQIDKEGSHSGHVARDDFRLGVLRLGWEMPSLHVLDDIFHSMDDQEGGTGKISLSKLGMRLRELAHVGQADGATLNMTTGKVLTPRIRAPTSNRYPTRNSLEDQFLESLLGQDRREIAAAKLEAERPPDADAMQRRRDAIRASRRSRESRDSKESLGVGQLVDIAEAGPAPSVYEAGHGGDGGGDTPRAIARRRMNGPDVTAASVDGDTPSRRRRTISYELAASSADGDTPSRRRRSISSDVVFDSPRASAVASEAGDDNEPGVLLGAMAKAPPVHMLDLLDAPGFPAKRSARAPDIPKPVTKIYTTTITHEIDISPPVMINVASSNQSTPRSIVGAPSPSALLARGTPRPSGGDALPIISPPTKLSPGFMGKQLVFPGKRADMWDEKCAEARDRAPFDGRSTQRELFYRARTTCVPVCTSVTRWDDPDPVPPRTPARYKASPRRQVGS